MLPCLVTLLVHLFNYLLSIIFLFQLSVYLSVVWRSSLENKINSVLSSVSWAFLFSEPVTVRFQLRQHASPNFWTWLPGMDLMTTGASGDGN